MTTFAELQQEVIDHQFSEAKYSDFALKQLRRAEAVVAAECNFRELQRTFTITTASGYPSYFLPADFQRNYSVSRADAESNQFPLFERQQTQFDALPIQAGAPSDYLIYSNTLKVWPTPDGVYTILLDYYAVPDATSESPSIPEEHRHILVDWALARCYARENDYNSSNFHRGLFETELMKVMAKTEADTEDAGQPRVIGDALTNSAPVGPRRP